MSAVVLVAVLALGAGAALGLLGGGGSILTVPILVFAGGLEPRSAIATSLLVVGLSSGVAAGVHAKRGGVDVRAGLSLGVASMVGAFGGGRLGRLLPATWLLAAFTVMMAITAVAMMRKRAEGAPSAATVPWIRTSAVGLAVGTLTGLVGAGGGFVIVPALVLFCGLSMRRAVGTSLLVIAMNSAAGFAGAAGAATIDPAIATAATTAATLGALAGVFLSAKIPAATLRAAFAWLVLGMSVFLAAKQLPADALARMPITPSNVAAALVGAGIVAAAWIATVVRRTLAATAATAQRARHAHT